jgi:site-specific DNA-adenine methylase
LSLKAPMIHPADLPKAASLVRSKIPKGLSDVESLFLTGGSIELMLSGKGLNVKAHTHNQELFTFWACLSWDALRVAKIAKELRPFFRDEETFYQFQETRNESLDPFVRSAIFFALNRSSKSGLVSSGKYDEGCPRFTDLSISNIAQFKFNNLIVNKVENYVDAVTNDIDRFLICCPYEKFTERKLTMAPLAMEMRRIQHMKLRSNLFNRENWILIYELNSDVIDAYSGYNYELYGAGFNPVNNFDRAKYILIFANNL